MRIGAAVVLFAVCCFGSGCSFFGEETLSKITDLTEEKYVNLYGRNGTDKAGVTFYNAASGFEVRIFGTSLTISAYAYGEWDSMFSVFVDGEQDSNARVVSLRTAGLGAEQIALVSDLSEGEHSIKVLKRTDSYRTAAVVESIETDGKFLSAPARSSMKIEFFGDSITSGSGILREVSFDEQTGQYRDSGVYTAQTQNALQSYAYVATQELGAEARYYGRGGIAMNYSSGVTMLNNPSALAVDLDPERYPYDYNSWTPDVVVIYLGTNDYNIGMQNSSLNYSSEGLQAVFVRFLRNVIGAYYSNEIPIVLCSGLMVPAAELDEAMKGVKQMLPDFPNLATIEFEACAIGHPIVEENRVAGELLAAKIQEMIVH